MYLGYFVGAAVCCMAFLLADATSRAVLFDRDFFSINCHMHTEAADFLGGLRPTRKQHSTEDEVSAHYANMDTVVVK